MSRKTKYKCIYCMHGFNKFELKREERHTNILCPSCKRALPADFDDIGHAPVISLCGGVESGKTLFIVSLINQLRTNETLKNELNISGELIPERPEEWGSDTGLNLYKRYLQQLMAGRLPNKTSTKDSANKVPIITEVTKSKNGDVVKNGFLTFYDTSGEEFHDQEALLKEHPNIDQADGLIILIDPLQIYNIYTRLRKNSNLLFNDPVFESSPRAVSRNIFGAFRAVERTNEKESISLGPLPPLNSKFKSIWGKKNFKIDVPTAFCISKYDYIKQIDNLNLPYDSSLTDLIDFNTNDLDWRIVDEFSQDAKRILDHYDPELRKELQNKFPNSEFFVASSFESTDDIQKIKSMESRGVLLPLLWLLKKVWR